MTVQIVFPELPAAAADSPTLQSLLPALQRLLGLARRRSAEPGWRSGLLQELAPAMPQPTAPVAVAAMALPDAPAASWWFAQPVHQLAGISRVHLHPEGVLRLSPEEASELAAAFARDLGGAGATLHALGDGLICASTDPACGEGEQEDPVHWRGRELSPAYPPLSRGLRRLATETEMWLHGLPLNQLRQQRGELPVTRLWLWGGAPPATARTAGNGTGVALGVALGADPMLHGLAALGLCAAPAPVVCAAERVPEEGSLIIAGLPLIAGHADLAALDAQWFAPLCQALEQGRIRQAVLRFGGSRWQLREPGALRRWWRRK